jgi:hypothetical protein
MKNVLAKQNSINPSNDFVVAKVTAESADKTIDELKVQTEAIQNLDKSLNSNVVRLSAQLKKQNEVIQKQFKQMSGEQSRGITDKVMGRREFRTVKPRVEDLKEGIKDFFSMRGFLDKTGIVKRKSGGLVSEYLDRAEERKKYVNQRMKVDPTAKLHGEDKAREIFSRQFNEQQDVELEMRKNERALKELKDSGFTEEQIKRSAEFKKAQELATKMAKADTRVRPEGFDVKKGMIRDDGVEAEETTKTKGGQVIPFKKKEVDNSLGSEEAMIEQNKLVEEQTDILRKIEENTRGGLGGGGGDGKQKGGDGGGSLLDGLLGMGKAGLSMAGTAAKGAGKLAASAGKGLLGFGKTVGMGLLQRAGPLAAVTAAGAGVYAGYSKYQEAKGKETEALQDVDARVKSGDLNRKQADAMKASIGQQATMDKAGAIGSGAGQAVGGVAGALKGAALGAAVGSAVPVVGTVIGGAIGATVGAIGGSYLGNKIGEFGGKTAVRATNAAKGLYASAKDAGNRLMGWGQEKVDIVKDVYNRGNSGTARGEGFNQEVRNRALTAGAIGEDGTILDKKKYDAVRKQVADEMRATGDRVSGTQKIGSKTTLNEDTVNESDGISVTTRSMNEGITAEKSVLGSTMLGKFFAAKGTETGSFMGQRSEEALTIAPNGKETTKSKFSTLMGERKSGGFFGKDTHTITDPETGEAVEVTGFEYRKIRKLVEKNDIAGANKAFAAIKEAKKGDYDQGGVYTTAMGDTVGATAVSVQKASAENESLKLSPPKSASTTVNAPTVNNVNNTTKTEVKAPIRNQESAQSKYLAARYF